jgi:hypothetical protein
MSSLILLQAVKLVKKLEQCLQFTNYITILTDAERMEKTRKALSGLWKLEVLDPSCPSSVTCPIADSCPLPPQSIKQFEILH